MRNDLPVTAKDLVKLYMRNDISVTAKDLVKLYSTLKEGYEQTNCLLLCSYPYTKITISDEHQ